jgi:hypothetical protein
MPEDLQPGASTGEPQTAMPEGQDPPEKLIPEADLRKFQSQADKRQAELQSQLEAAQSRVAAAEQQMGALQASMAQLAQETMEPEDAQAFITQQQQAQDYAALQRDATLHRRRQYADNLAEQYGIPPAEFNAVINNPTATQQDALKVVSDYLEKKAAELGKAHTTASAEAETAAAQQERQVRREEGSDQIGSQAEPATGSPDLEAKYKAEKAALVKRSWADPRRGDWNQDMANLKAKYREQGLQIP